MYGIIPCKGCKGSKEMNGIIPCKGSKEYQTRCMELFHVKDVKDLKR
jgi:hypothetical protein